MSHRLTPPLLELLRATSADGKVPATLRDLSDLRWLEHLEMVVVDADGRFRATATGRALAGSEVARE